MGLLGVYRCQVANFAQSAKSIYDLSARRPQERCPRANSGISRSSGQLPSSAAVEWEYVHQVALNTLIDQVPTHLY